MALEFLPGRLILAWILALVAPAAAAPPAGSPASGLASRLTEVTFWSRVLRRDKAFSVVRPPGDSSHRALPVLFLLHGRGRTHRTLVELPTARHELLSAPFFIVLPDGEDGWYINSPLPGEPRYGDYLTEVIGQAEARFPISRLAPQRAIAGWSMGGYGAVCFAETHPHDFAAVVSVIGLWIFPRPADLPPGQNYPVPTRHFGGDPAVWREFDPAERVDRLRSRQVLLITARQSFDRTMNERFLAGALAGGVDCRLVEREGSHTLETVVAALPEMFRFVESVFIAGRRR